MKYVETVDAVQFKAGDKESLLQCIAWAAARGLDWQAENDVFRCIYNRYSDEYRLRADDTAWLVEYATGLREVMTNETFGSRFTEEEREWTLPA